jgi:hypothetical protein
MRLLLLIMVLVLALAAPSLGARAATLESGFSGTARFAWLTAAELEDNIAGIIGFGGGLPPEYQPPREARYGFYGAAGFTDFNFEEMLALAKRWMSAR